MEKTKKDFEIGLVLAGAVSAGAYTAGVMDFLLEALEEWNDAKKAGEKVPMHNVKIKVITGASAGGMTAAMAAVEIRKRATQQGNTGKSSSFKRAWVDLISIEKLLDCDDLNRKEKKPILSLLNSSVIDEIANEIIRIEDGVWKALPYVADELKVYLSLSNLRGIPYKFDLAGESGFPYEMTTHSDYQYVEISSSTSEKDWDKLKKAALATGAFPIGLSARIIERSKKEYEKRLKEDGLNTSKLMEVGDDDNFDFVAVDGGLLNNEPLEWAKAALYSHKPDAFEQQKTNEEILKNISEQKKVAEPQKNQDRVEDLKKQKGLTISNAIIMVDPFPNINKKTQKPEAHDIGLFNIIGPVLGAMRSQCMFKPEELLQGTSDDIFDRFLVAPIRHRKGDEHVIEKNPLASGFFEGFGGFLFHDFRNHDYYLGRRNCQQFLKYYFSLPEEYIRENEIFKGNILEDYLVTPPCTRNKTSDSSKRYPIIPLVGQLQKDEPTLDWPTYSVDKFNTFKKLLAKRIFGLVTKAIPFTAFTLFIWLLILGAGIGISLIHFYQYCSCGRWGTPCDNSMYHIASFSFGLLEFILMLMASVLLILLGALHIVRVWAKMKVIRLIEDYLKDYNLNIK